MAKKVQLQTNGKEWRDGQYVDVEKHDIDPITSSSCVQIEGFRTLEEAVSDNKMLSQDLTYTKVMDKVGGDYHQNVLDGQYSKAILYGNTQVNLCEEDTSVALQIPTTFTSFNNGELQINNKENQVVAPLIKGVTMVNLAQTNSASLASSESVAIENVKGNTLYTLSFKFTTKNTNSGITIQCYDGDGTFIENTMHKTGLGDIVKFTFTTHANATKIHICNNAAYGGETIQLDEIMLIEGDQTGLDIPFFKGMKSVELVRPLTNLFNNDLEHYDANVTSTNNNGTVTVTASSSISWAGVHYNLTNLKAHTNYLVMWDSVSTTQTSTTNTNILICMVRLSNNGNLGKMDNNSLNPTKRCIMFNTGDIPLTDIVLRIHATLSNTETGTTTVKGLRVFEYDDYLRSVDLQSIGWFSGTKNVAVEPIKTCSKNLYPYGDVNFTSAGSNWYDAKGNINMYGDIASKSKSRFLLKKGTYTLSIGSTQNIEQYGLVDDKETAYGNTFTLSQDTYMTLRFKRIQADTLTTATNIQIERGGTASDYVAHDSRYYEPNGQNVIVLRSLPNGVCDTFNLQTGEYTRRIGEVVLNGSENWGLNKTLGDGSFNQFVVSRVQAKKVTAQLVNCDKLISSSNESINNRIWIYDGTTVVIHSSCRNVDELKTWLQQNPLTVQYEFREPSTTIIPRTIKRNNNGTTSTIDFKTYTNKESLTLPSNPSYLTINSMTSIKPVVEPITYVDFKTRLKGNTDYSVIMDKDGANKTINLGGTSKTYADKMLVRTPSIDLEQNLRISGSGSIQNIMVIEGDVLHKELPYFNGMCNVKMPIVRNCGKNLFNINDLDSSKTSIINNREFQTTDIYLDTYINIKVKPNTTYSICLKAYKDGGNATGLVMCIHDGKNTGYNDTTSRLAIIVNVPSAYDHRSTVFTTKSDYISLSSLDKIFIKDLTIIESNTVDTDYIPYRGNDICIAQGEIGLSQDMFEQGTTAHYAANIGKTYQWMKENSAPSYDARRLRTKSLIKVEPNTKLILQNTDNLMYSIFGYGANKLSLGTFDTSWIQNTTITIPQDVHYISFVIRKKDDTNININDFKRTNFKLLKLDDIIALRSLPNGVKDELNLLTGEYIQRVGEIVLDGSENWAINNTQTTTTNRFILKGVIKSDMTDATLSWYMVDKLPKTKWSDSCQLGITLTDGKIFLYNNSIEYNISALKSWLSQNPITVQYELAEPIISYPRIVSNTQEREVGVKLPNGVCDTYNPSTGITVKRVGKIVLDGSENWKNANNYTNTYRFKLTIPDAQPRTGIVCHDMYVRKHDEAHGEYEYIINFDDAFYLNLLKTKLSTLDVAGVKTYLASNPITVWYELKNPIVTTDIVLPNGVHDEYNPLTGLYTKRVGFIEFDGSEDWHEPFAVPTSGAVNMYNIWTEQPLNNAKPAPTNERIPGVCDSLKFKNSALDLTNEEFYFISPSGRFNMNLSRSKLSEPTEQALKTYLSQNPIKLWYELQTPITYQLTPYFGLPMPYAYKDGYLIMDSAYNGQTLPPEITYQLTVNRTGQITQNNIKLKEHTARLSNLEYILIEATLDSIFNREMQNFELELMNVELFNLDE